MKIRRVAIRNYRQYRQLDLDLTSLQSDVAVVVGSNGTGKTNLLNAIIWCLYGREDYYGREMESSPLANQKTLDDSAENSAVPVSVTLQLEFANGMEAEVRRTQQFIKHGKTTGKGPIELSVQAFDDHSKGHEKVGNPEHWIDRWVPQRLEPYFLFDGERLNDFFRHAEAKKVEDAVLQIAQIDLLKRLTEHLERVSGSLYSAAGKSGGYDLTALAEKNDAFENELAEAEADVAIRKAQVEACTNAVRMLEGKIGNVKEIMTDLRRRKDLEAELDQIDSELGDSWRELHTWAVSNAAAALSADALAGLRSTIDEARREHRLPPPVDPQFLAGLLEQDQCICGTSLDAASDEGAAHRAALEAVLVEYARVGELGSLLLQLDDGVRDSLARVRHAAPAADSILKRISDWQHRQETAAESLKVLSSKLAGHEDAHVQQTEAELTRAKDDLDKAARELMRREWQVGELRKDILVTQQELERLATKAEKARAILHQARFAKHCLGVATEMYDELTNEVRTNVAASLQSHFKNMMWKQEAIQAVSIDESYRVSVRNNLGYEILGDLAAGERECLALAFSLALSEVSGYELPMIIDTPMGRLNPDVQCFVAGVLAESTKAIKGEPSHQLVMLMTETEYSADVAKVLAVRSPHVFHIEFDESESTARLVEVK